MKNNIRLIFFDMEGTLFRKAIRDTRGNIAPSAWPLIARGLGEQCRIEEEATQEKWINGGYAGYVEWAEETVLIYRKHGLTRDLFEKILSSIEYHPGVHEAFQVLRERRMKTALISGGFKAQADRALRDLKINHAFATCEFLWNGDGTIGHYNLLPCDYEGKLDFMRLIMKEHGLRPGQCAFVGDGKNDIPLAKSVGLSIAFNGHPDLQRACTHPINQPEGREDFREILKYL